MTARAPAPARSALILHGAVAPGAAADDEDTLVQVGVVTAALRKLGFAVETLEVGRDLADVARPVEAIAPDFAFNLVEQIDGRDALLPLAAYLLERARIPYTGAPAAALAASTEKTLAKRLMAAAGIPTPEWCETGMEAGQLSPDDGLWIVKSATEHASFGLSAASVVRADAVAGRLRRCTDEHGGSWFAERYIHGREFNVSLLAGSAGPQVLPVSEIVFIDCPPERPAIVDYAAKWQPDSAAYGNTPRRLLGAEAALLAGRLGQIALRCWHLFGLRGYARVDFRVDESGTPFVLEVNANPCLSPDAGFAAAADAAGIDLVEVVGRIVVDAGIRLPRAGNSATG